MPEYDDNDFRELAEVLTDARLVHGISAPMSLARWLLDRGYRRTAEPVLAQAEAHERRVVTPADRYVVVERDRYTYKVHYVRPVTLDVAREQAERLREIAADGGRGEDTYRVYELVAVPCCDMHNRHCEPPGDLCCRDCTEAAHDTFPIRHADGTPCVLTSEGGAE